MKNLLACTALAICVAACGGGGVPCDDQNPCPEGQACNREGDCVSASALRITTEELDQAVAGVAYQFTVQAEGGLPPYHDWTVESDLGWLSIDAAAGTLQGTPDQGTLGTAVTVAVLDSSWGDGAKASRSFQMAVLDCTQEGVQIECFDSGGESCSAGLRTCSDGLWSACVHTGPSQDFDHCGAECSACDTDTADRCLGNCQCGDGAACAAGLRCCLAVCLDTSSSMRHCGECGNECSAQTVLNSTGIGCHDGSCDYVACQEGFLDCDGARANGCETAVGPARCGGCDIDCSAQVTGVTEVLCLSAGPGVFRCDYDACSSGNADCDQLRRNGCEAWLGDPQSCGDCSVNCPALGTNRACIEQAGHFLCGCTTVSDCSTSKPEQCCGASCRPLGDDDACGSCQNDCSVSPLGPLCIDPAQQLCGCFTRFDCDEKEICCNDACLPVDDSHCGDCAIACNAAYGGPHCDVFSEQCYCESNAECQGYGSGVCQGTGTEARCR